VATSWSTRLLPAKNAIAIGTVCAPGLASRFFIQLKMQMEHAKVWAAARRKMKEISAATRLTILLANTSAQELNMEISVNYSVLMDLLKNNMGMVSDLTLKIIFQ
jgi:nucleosome binding factor SPN SPT16 subunit